MSGVLSPSAVKLSIAARERVGCKGPAAVEWLASRGINVPRGWNRYSVDSAGVLCARVATSEFLLEATDDRSDASLAALRAALERADTPSGVYAVLRDDFVLEISGTHMQDLFLQTCAVDLDPIARESTVTTGPVVLTSMMGVSVVLACRQLPDGPRFTAWSDPSTSAYFHSQLQAIAAEIRGEAGGVHP
jgi:hypothetical protein